MASILHIDTERKDLENRLKDFDDLEQNIFPEVSSAVEDLGYDCVVSPKHSADSVCFDTFRVSAVKNDKIQGFVDVKFPTATETGDYKVSLVDNGNEIIETQMVGRSDLVDVIESMFAALTGTVESKSESEYWHNAYTKWQVNAIDADDALKRYIVVHDREHKTKAEYILKGNSSDTMSTAVLWCGNDRVVGFEFEGRSKYRIVWYCFGEEVDEGHLDTSLDEPARQLVQQYLPDIKDALSSFYGIEIDA